MLSKREKRLDDSQSGFGRLIGLIRPFLFIFGLIFMCVTLLIVFSLIMTNFDKALNSVDFCGSACGFMIAYPKIVNPINTILTYLAAVRNKKKNIYIYVYIYIYIQYQIIISNQL